MDHEVSRDLAHFKRQILARVYWMSAVEGCAKVEGPHASIVAGRFGSGNRHTVWYRVAFSAFRALLKRGDLQ